MHHPVLCPITPQGAKFGRFTHHARKLGLITHGETPLPPCFTSALLRCDKVGTGHGKHGKSWNLRISFSRPGKS